MALTSQNLKERIDTTRNAGKTPEQIMAAIKAQHPELESQAQQFLGISTAQKVPPKKEGLLIKAARTFAPLGESIGTALATPELKRLQEQQLQQFLSLDPRAQTKLGFKPITEEIPLPSTRQVVGQAVTTGLSALPTAGGAKVPIKGIVGRAGLRQIATGAPIGAAAGLGVGLQADKKGKELIAPTVTGGLVGTAASAVAQILPTIQKLAGAEKQLNRALSAVKGKPVKAKTIVMGINPIIKELRQTAGEETAVRQLEKIRKAVLAKGNLTATEAQQQKTSIYQVIGKFYGREAAPKKEAQKAVARGLRTELERVAPGVADINKFLSRVQNVSSEAQRIARGKLFGFGDIAAAGIGKLVFGGTGGTAASLIGRRLAAKAIKTALSRQGARRGAKVPEIINQLLQRGGTIGGAKVLQEEE